MINLIKADFFRVRKNKFSYLILLLIVSFLIIIIANKGVFYFTTPTEADAGEFYNQLEYYNSLDFTGIVSLQVVTKSATILPLFIYPLFYFLITGEFNKRTYVNVLSKNQGRTQYFFSKILGINIMTMLVYLFYYLSSFIIASALNGIGDFDPVILISIIKIISLQILLQFFWNTICISFIFVTKFSLLGFVIYVALPYIFVALSISMPIFNYFSLLTLIDNVSFIVIRPMENEAFIISLIALCLSLSIGNYFFKYRDIK